jgi:hypothetical protein
VIFTLLLFPVPLVALLVVALLVHIKEVRAAGRLGVKFGSATMTVLNVSVMFGTTI